MSNTPNELDALDAALFASQAPSTDEAIAAVKELYPSTTERAPDPPSWTLDTVGEPVTVPPYAEAVVQERAAGMSKADISALLHRASLAKSRISENELTATRDRERILQSIAADLDRVDTFLAEETEADRRIVAEATAIAEAWMRRRLAEMDAKGIDGKRSEGFAWARITTRKQEPEFVRDEDVLRSWAEGNGYMRPPADPSVDWASLKKAAKVRGDHLVSADGELIPGVEVIPREPSVTVEIV